MLRKPPEAAHKALEIYPEALDAMAVLGTIDSAEDKKDIALDDEGARRSIRTTAKPTPSRHISSSSTAAMTKGSRSIAKRSKLDPVLKRARSDMGVN